MRRFLVSGAVAVIATGVLVTPAAANHSWGNYHWARTANPFTIAVGDNVDAGWDRHLATAVSDWSADTAAGNPLNATVVGGAAKGRQCKPSAGRVEVCNGRYGATGWYGIATIWIASGGHITQGTARMNDYYMAGAPEVSKAHVMCQEVGHDWGLDHQDESGRDLNTCMDYADSFDNAHPNQHDYDQLAAIYSHLDRFTTIGSGSTGLAGRDGARPYKTERRDDRRSSRIVEFFADDSKRITFIDWAA
jgi:hypothetical protein